MHLRGNGHEPVNVVHHDSVDAKMNQQPHGGLALAFDKPSNDLIRSGHNPSTVSNRERERERERERARENLNLNYKNRRDRTVQPRI